ncbi:protein arginine methyltransferase NDUFAF7 homolog, mitochondrial isoform X2 [Andrographis paniculata]|uniref:protein arginine methyltransferase NDUFAF7 homolog, mitochondrial isoform X2 n=1 Tax=Andrographis paniculata TaxID=175694 RepID=UPI0021E7D9CA|nr:protein arginine methyltransferase NDUFAF7 homolog, mitochondrial isoform X2 [Andrographis paniculata]
MAARAASPKRLSAFLSSPKVIPFSPANYCTNILGESPVLVRDFIHAALYHPEHGYFSQRSGSVGVLDRSIKFHQLEGRKAYMKHLDAIYKQSDSSWFTPVELFKPWYAHGIAEAILRTANLSIPLKIYEIGGGSGTCAKGVMDYIKLNAPTRVYDNMTYTSVEISSSLSKIQLETVGEVHSHSAKFRVECRDASDPNGWGVEQQPCWVIMLEVLDNLPHDLIYSENQVSPWMEVWVQQRHDTSDFSELYKPLHDPLIGSCMEILDLAKDGTTRGTMAGSVAKSIWSKIFPRPRRCWLPTGCLKLLRVLHGALPKMSLIASDFSYLPDVRIPGERAPLVASKEHGKSSDLNSYLDAKGDADIFFPTDFRLLERIDHYCSGWWKPQEDNSSKKGRKRRTLALDTASFMEEFGLPSKTRTRDGYNPMLDDFKNTKFYLSVPTHNIK